ncbi:C39 family peptidase [Bifidobacterium miconisargentati]|uniref:C39 family peptidase n=1 Tax=Bifidobacterium miconisargentati TaxID=2834437 RepID=UPI001BDD23DA|nr:C39 family peptidase [Bifidobacterium miconisargentati]MBW3090129.1 C39 family peptidase [Bifidobacterium miconisargentati]
MKRTQPAVLAAIIVLAALLGISTLMWDAGRIPSRFAESSHANQTGQSQEIAPGGDQSGTKQAVPEPASLHDPKELAGLNAGVDDSYPGDDWFCNAAGEKAGASSECVDREVQTEPSTARVMLDVPQRVQETGYWCVPGALQMVLAYKGIDADQTTLAERMNTKPVTGTEYVDLARVANAYLFGDETATPSGAGYRVQTIAIGDRDPSVAQTFADRVKADLADDYPVFAAVDVHVLYPWFGHGNHVVVVMGYDTDENGTITQYHILDPSYNMQDPVHAGHKVVDAATMMSAIVDNEEPAYVW